jgi:hypothetical protein
MRRYSPEPAAARVSYATTNGAGPRPYAWHTAVTEQQADSVAMRGVANQATVRPGPFFQRS